MVIEMLGHESNLLLGVKQLALFGAVLGLVFSTGAISYQAAFADDDDDDKKFKKHKVLTGDGPPPEKLGKKGDLYFDTSDGGCMDFHVKIMKKEWEQRGTLCDESLIMIDWSQINVDTIPKNLLELASLDCDDGEIAKTESGEWECAEDDKVESLEELLQCDDGEIAKFESGEWECAADDDTLNALIPDCNADQIAVFDGSDWSCEDQSGGDLSIITETTVIDDGDDFTGEGGSTETFEGIPAGEQVIFQLSCTSGLVSGYNVLVEEAPFTVSNFESLNSNQGVQLEIFNHGVTTILVENEETEEEEPEVAFVDISKIGFILFCATVE